MIAQKLDHAGSLSTLLVQARLAWKSPAENRTHLEQQLAQCAKPFDLAVFPETFTTGFLGDPNVPSEDMDGPTLDWMKTLAAKRNCALAGSAVIVVDGQRFNRFLLVTARGEVHHYDKRHLFGYGGENQRYAAGRQRRVFKLGDWRICPQICYDLRFPVWCRNRDDYDLLVFVANWPVGRIQHWTALLQARAIENQAWVIGVNRVGEDGNGVAYPGCSQVYDPAGKLVADLQSNEEARVVELALARVAGIRSEFPFQADADRFEPGSL
ncbi:MAG TPA: amidohydrolase [Xanthomonadales bacterium]|nr:amidohydrolase [Xanthomonadales bacterium]